MHKNELWICMPTLALLMGFAALLGFATIDARPPIEAVQAALREQISDYLRNHYRDRIDFDSA